MANEIDIAKQANSLPTSDSPDQFGQMFAGLMAVVKDPNADPAKMSAALEVMERMNDRRALMEFNRARMAAMAEMPVITKDGKIMNKGNVQSRFATFEAIDRIVRPVCIRHGLVYGFNLQQGPNASVMVTCELGHVGGHVQNYGPMQIPLDNSGAKNAAQGAGSAASYGKRYTLCAALNIVTEGQDDDGQSAGRQRNQIPDADAWQGQVLDDARRAATGGAAAYQEFFKTKLTNMQRGWLVDTGEHENLKTAAAEYGD